MKTIIALVVLFGVIVGSLGWWLSPNDLSDCDAKPSEASGCQAADAIVAISGGDTAARVDEAVQLYQNGWADKLIFSGAAADKSGPSNAEVMRQQAIDAGVAPTAILLDETSENTQENAENTRHIMDGQEISSIILVTSAYHQRRASIEFNRAVPNVAIRNHPTPDDNQWSSLWWLSPVSWYLVIAEVAKITIISMSQ